jgi:hypothetical protein
VVGKVYTQMNDGHAKTLDLLLFADRVAKGREEDRNILPGLTSRSEDVIRTFFPDMSLRDSGDRSRTLRNMIQNLVMR